MQGVLAGPRTAGGLGPAAHGIGVDRHVCAAPVVRSSVVSRDRWDGVDQTVRSGRSRTCWRWAGLGDQGGRPRRRARRRRRSGPRAIGPAVPALAHRDHAAGDVEHPPGDVGGLGAGQPADDRGDVGRRHLLLGLLVGLTHAQALGHAGQGGGGDGVDGDAVAAELHGRDDREAGDAGLGRAVVGLAHVAVDARRRRRVDDAGVVGLAGLGALPPVRGGVPARREGALQVDLDDGVPLRLAHVGEHAVAEDPGVVDEDVETAEGVHGGLDEALRRRPSR